MNARSRWIHVPDCAGEEVAKQGIVALLVGRCARFEQLSDGQLGRAIMRRRRDEMTPALR
jgi:hypothetical protein